MKNISVICSIFFFLLTQSLFAQWKLTGNSGTNPSTQFLGTIDSVDLVVRTHNLERLRVSARGNLGLGTASPSKSALLDITSTSKGVLFPRMTKSQRDAIGAPATGLLIYQTNSTAGFYYYSGSAWTAVSPSGANKSLSNLTAPTTVNVDLLPNANNTLDLGNGANSWRDIYLDGSIYLDGVKFTSNAGLSSNFVGTQAGSSNTGSNNCGVGYQALSSSTSGYYNTAVGSYSLPSNSTGHDNTALGASALADNNESYNVAVGSLALANTGASQNNTAVGFSAGAAFDNGYNNVFVGSYAQAGGDGYYNDVAIGHGIACTASNQAAIGNSSTTTIGGFADWTNFSDVRYKKNIQSNVPGLAFINLLKPITYTLDVDGIEARLHPANVLHKTPSGEIIPNPMDNPQMKQAMADKSKIVFTGFAAQEVEQAAQSVGYNFSGVDKPKDDQTGFYGLRYGDFVVPLVKAVQELDAENARLLDGQGKLKMEISDQQKQIEELKAAVKEIQSSIQNNVTLSTSASLSVNSVEGQKQSTTNLQSTPGLLGQNIPNPFDHTTTIPFSILQHCSLAFIIITESSNGRTLKTIPVSCSDTQVKIDASEFSSGNYSYSLIVDGKVIDTREMTLTK